MTRARLPNRRETTTIEIEHYTPQGDPQPLAISIGCYEDGTAAEVFVEVPYQLNRTFNALLGKDVATLISIALQHGASLEELQAAMGRGEINVMGEMVDRPHTLAGAVLDAMVKELTQ